MSASRRRSRKPVSPGRVQSTQSQAPERIKIFIVDDHPLIREGLAARIGQEPEMEICGLAESVQTALAGLESARPDVMIVDLALNDSHGLELIKRVKATSSRTRILVLSAYSEAVFGERALRLGAHGYVNKQQAQKCVITAIRTVAAGRRYLSEQLADRLLSYAIAGRKNRPLDVEDLSVRELEVFELIGEGKSTRAIAEHLHLSVHTIETHREKIRAKLDLRSGSELVQRAVQWVIESR